MRAIAFAELRQWPLLDTKQTCRLHRVPAGCTRGLRECRPCSRRARPCRGLGRRQGPIPVACDEAAGADAVGSSHTTGTAMISGSSRMGGRGLPGGKKPGVSVGPPGSC